MEEGAAAKDREILRHLSRQLRDAHEWGWCGLC
jgi:hypothetical protein